MPRVCIRVGPKLHELWYGLRFLQLDLSIATAEAISLLLKLLGFVVITVCGMLDNMCAIWEV